MKTNLTLIVTLVVSLVVTTSIAMLATWNNDRERVHLEVVQERNRLLADAREVHDLVMDPQALQDHRMLMEELQKIVKQNQEIHAKEGQMEQEAASFTKKKFDNDVLDVKYLTHDTKILCDSAAEEVKRKGLSKEQEVFGPLILLRAKTKEAHDAAVFFSNTAFE